MKKIARILVLALAVVLVFALFTPAVLAEQGLEEDPVVETEDPMPGPIDTEDPMPGPIPTPVPTEDAGRVDLVIYAYNNGIAADGYTVTIDETSQRASSEGKVTFPSLTVEGHSIRITDKDGKSSAGFLYMSRAGNTGITSQASGGTYGVDVMRGATSLYMNAHFTAGSDIMLDKVSDQAPSPLPQPTATAVASGQPAAPTATTQNGESFDSKNITAQFKDEDGKEISGMGVELSVAGLPISLNKTTGSDGTIQADGVPYGSGKLAFDRAGVEELNLTLQKGVQTGIVSTGTDETTVSVAASAKNVSLAFQQQGNRFVLKEVSEKAISGSGSMAILGLVIVLIIVGVVLTIVLVRRAAKKAEQQRQPRYQGQQPRYQNQQTTHYPGQEPRQVEPVQPRRTGGGNKFEDNAPKPKDRFDDRSRM